MTKLSQSELSPASGMTLLELMVAVTILAIGLGGGMALVSAAIASNNRAKLDTSSTVLSQLVLEQILAAGANATSTFTITDCQGNNFTVDPSSSTSGRGAPLDANGNINFSGTLSPSTGYNMNYVVCKANGNTATFDVRWNITTLVSSASTVFTKQVTVAARPLAATMTGTYSQRFFAIPVNLKGVAGNNPN